MPKERKSLKDFVNKIDEACGEGREFIITLKYDKREEALKRILKKCHLEKKITGILTKGKYKNKDISIFKTGKLVIKQFQGKEEAENFLAELLQENSAHACDSEVQSY